MSQKENDIICISPSGKLKKEQGRQQGEQSEQNKKRFKAILRRWSNARPGKWQWIVSEYRKKLMGYRIIYRHSKTWWFFRMHGEEEKIIIDYACI